MSYILIKNGTLVSDGKEWKSDIFISNGKIERIEEEIEPSGLLQKAETQVIDASGCYVFPGFIDAHTHLDMYSGTTHTADDFSSGTKAAIAGGTTTIIDFATQEKGEALKTALLKWHKKAEGKSSCNYGFHMAITDWQPEAPGILGTASQMEELVSQGVSSYKLYMAYDALRLSDPQIYEVLKVAHRLDVLVGNHCENGDMVNWLINRQKNCGNVSPAAHPESRPDWLEAEAISRFLYLAELADVPVHIVHLSTKAGLEEIKLAGKRNQKVFVETCPQYLTLTDSVYKLKDFEGAKFVCSPPIRSKKDQQALWKALSTDGLSGEIQTISTDHCSFNFCGQKDLGKNDFSKIPNGLPGLQHRPQLIFTFAQIGDKKEKLTPSQFSSLMGENAAKLFGMFPLRGTLREGSFADITVWNPDYKGVIHALDSYHQCDYSPYENIEIQGRAEQVIVNGIIVASQGVVIAENQGHYIKRHTGFPN